MDGFIVVDKPAGMTSHDVVNRVRRITGQKKAGHTGTLDPFATGVLPVALGEATKAIPFLDEAVKEYQAVVLFGRATDTQDCTGVTISEGEWQRLIPEEVMNLATSFVGKIRQLPPMYSALKHHGTPLYKLARRGVDVERPVREVEIHSLDIDGIELPEVRFTVRCSRGTYVRTLAHDMGEKAGCGAHLVMLRRTLSGSFSIGDSVSLERLCALAENAELRQIIVSPVAALPHIREILLTERGAIAVRHGIAPGRDDMFTQQQFLPAERVALTFDGMLAAVAEITSETGPNTAVSMRLLRVFN